MKATALIAEDEPLLAQALQAELARAWPELQMIGTVADGSSAVVQALALRPDILFLDIRMPGQTGLQAAAELADEWPEGQPFPALVFVTAYDAYAVEAFEKTGRGLPAQTRTARAPGPHGAAPATDARPTPPDL